MLIATGLLAYFVFRSVTYGAEIASNKNGDHTAGQLANLVVAVTIALIALGVLLVNAFCYNTT